MAYCEQCNQLSGSKSSVGPHDKLILADSRKYKAYGMATGKVETYQCQTCGEKMRRDMDQKDKDASWEKLV